MNILYRLFDGGEVPECHNGSWFDLKSNATIEYAAGDYVQIPLGIAMKLSPGMEGWLLPRSSLFKKTGLLIANGMGIIDPSYCGNDDQWFLCAYATRFGKIERGDRICQFRLMPAMTSWEKINLVQCTKLPDDDRGGIGSTGGYNAT